MNFPAFWSPEFLRIPASQQQKLLLITIWTIIISSNPANSRSLTSSPTTGMLNSPDLPASFQPRLAVVIGVLAVMSCLTFLLMVYAKCCHRPSSIHYSNQENLGEIPRSVISRVFSGIDKTVIESLPFFRFSTLKGWRDGLECSICLSKFEDIEILRLLPKCKHAFHINCVDKWLEEHSGCPLCRCKVTEEDVRLFASSSFRFLRNQCSDCAHDHDQGLNLELFIEREGSTRFRSGRSFRKIEEENDQEIFDQDQDQEILHKFNHRIIVSYNEHGLIGKNRWSDLRSSDLLCLQSEMITSWSSNFNEDQEKIASMSSNNLDCGGSGHDNRVIKIKEEIKQKREFEKKIKKFPGGESDIGSSNEVKSDKLDEKRSMSEIIVHPRLLDVELSSEEANLGEVSAKEERLKRLWLPIARRTVQLFANRDQQPQINTKSQI